MPPLLAVIRLSRRAFGQFDDYPADFELRQKIEAVSYGRFDSEGLVSSLRSL